MEPLGPTTTTPIVFSYSASCESLEQIVRNGSVITIRLADGPCSPPATEPLIIRLPEKTLPVGEYRVDVFARAGQQTFPRESMTFVVRHDPREPVLFHVRPSVALSVGGVPLVIESPVGSPDLCQNLDCTVVIGGISVTPRARAGRGIVVDAPPHAGGLVDVTVGQATVPGALYYYDINDYPLFSVFERILFPILFDTPGAGGSQWRTETSLANPNHFYVDFGNNIQPLVCVTFPCGERAEWFSYTKFNGGTHPQGIALLTPRTEAPYLSFASRVRDVSQDADSFGSEVPVVRERDMVRENAAALLDVPLDARYRVKLRIYAFDDSEDQEVPAIVRIDDTVTLPLRLINTTLRRTCIGAACGQTPYYGEIDLQPTALPQRVNLYVTTPGPNVMPRLKWAFASVTNNKTQQVTIISANGAGGDPDRVVFP